MLCAVGRFTGDGKPFYARISKGGARSCTSATGNERASQITEDRLSLVVHSEDSLRPPGRKAAAE